MDSISLLNLRNQLGDVIDRVHYTQKAVTVLKNGRPVAKVVPYQEPSEPIAPQQVEEEILAYNATLPEKYRFDSAGEELLSLIGSTTPVSEKSERELINQHLDEKYG